jgi:glyoxylase-like metal-dependent hydrolase (beta-lactamase superfamily II)
MPMRTSIVIIAVVVSWSSFASAQSGDGPYGNKYTINKLTPDVYTMTWALTPGSPAIGNSTFIIGDQDVVVVDTGFSKSAGEVILGALRAITPRPVSLVINTHWHGDHIFGNQVFRTAFPGARFVAHPETRAGIITGEIEYRAENQHKTVARIAELRAKATRTETEGRELRLAEWQIDAWQGDYVLPDLLVDRHLTVMQGNRRIDVVHLGDANTRGDLVVQLPAERVAISGDMAITPVPFAYFSSPRAWIRTLDALAALDVDTIVPGHGPAQTSRQFIRDLQAMLRSIVEQVDAGLKAGESLDALKAGVKLVAPAGSVYEKISPASLDRNFRIPAIESAVKEAKGS